jgi:uncharacterized CHY-type Zn-finger protein
MEEVLKGLQGKSLTKNKLFEFLANLDLTTLEKKVIRCEACMKTFRKESYLKRHYDKNTSCVTWNALPQKHNIDLPKGLHLILDDLLKNSISIDDKLECKFCNSTFTNTGNLHKHFNVSHVCNRLAYDEFKKNFNNL